MTKCIQCHENMFESLNAQNFYKKPSPWCAHCIEQWKAVDMTMYQRCPRCLKLLDINEEKCGDCLFLSMHYVLMNRLHCQFQYKGIMKSTIHKYKFMKDVALCKILAEQIELPKVHYDYIVPIPSPIERDKARTFNPVTTVLDYKQIQYETLLSTQLRPRQYTMGKQMRLQVDHPFEITSSIDLENKFILLVDDIYTTGITVHKAAKSLFVRKIRKFDVFTFAR
ncbi:ComF family protein [Staphylococcus succinus]|uniref:Amidophosphoribosyltransferase n=1 Tax=Staphylococcus succinus TaxID=61015 RepID=A0ABX5IMZ9_9STAP|nr:ComF family protein [Staphylococcus succinus]PTI69006.1 amidophosphoribosyltransferase [Staphylococcus succinus]RIN37534.1 ComF family protein [Staphylococcus succinus]